MKLVEREINIDIIGIHDGQKIVTHAIGKYAKKADSEYIEYIDDDGVKNLLKILADTLYLTKYTTPSTNMVFKENQKFEFKYQTAYGAMDLIMQTNELRIQRDGYDYDINIKYDVITNGESMARELTIKTR